MIRDIEIWCEDKKIGAEIVQQMQKFYFSSYNIVIKSTNGIQKIPGMLDVEVAKISQFGSMNKDIVIIYDHVPENFGVADALLQIDNRVRDNIELKERVHFIPIRCAETEILSVPDIKYMVQGAEYMQNYINYIQPILNKMQTADTQELTRITKSNPIYQTYYEEVRKNVANDFPQITDQDQIEGIVNFEKLSKLLLPAVLDPGDACAASDKFGRCWKVGCCGLKKVRKNCQAYCFKPSKEVKIKTLISRSNYIAVVRKVYELLGLSEERSREAYTTYSIDCKEFSELNMKADRVNRLIKRSILNNQLNK